MNRLVRAEARKVSASRLVAALGLGTLALLLVALSQVIVRAGVRGAPSLGTAEHLQQVLTIPALATTTMVVLGILLVTAEHRHGTITATYLISPRRGRVLAAKMVIAVCAGVAYALLCGAVVLAVAVPWLARLGVDVASLMGDQTVRSFVGTLAALPLYALLGLGLGALVRNQAGALAAALIWTLSFEQMLVARVWPGAFPWSLAGAGMSMAGSPYPANLLPAWAGALLLAAYGGALAVAAWAVTDRRDVL